MREGGYHSFSFVSYLVHWSSACILHIFWYAEFCWTLYFWFEKSCCFCFFFYMQASSLVSSIRQEDAVGSTMESLRLRVLALVGAGISGILSFATIASADEAEHGLPAPSYPWPHKGILSSYDHASWVKDFHHTYLKYISRTLCLLRTMFFFCFCLMLNQIVDVLDNSSYSINPEGFHFNFFGVSTHV